MAAGGLAPRAEPPSELPKYSQPDALLGRNAGTKERSDTEALYLANQGFEALAGFEDEEGHARYPNLRVLYVNNNRLEDLTGIRRLYRLQTLCARWNSISSVEAITRLKYLQELDLSFNMLQDLHYVRKMLSHLRFLKLLDLRGNACTDDPDYRVMIIHTIPSVEVLDSRMVKQEERRAAAIHLGESSAQAAQTIAFGRRRPTPVSTGPPQNIGEKELQNTLKRMRERSSRSMSQSKTEESGPTRLPPPPQGSLPLPASTSMGVHETGEQRGKKEDEKEEEDNEGKCRDVTVIANYVQMNPLRHDSTSSRNSGRRSKVSFTEQHSVNRSAFQSSYIYLRI